MNIVILSGNLTRDPQAGATQSGVPFCRFGIAMQKKYKDTNGEKGVDFFNCVAWRQTAEYCNKYLVKGKKVTIMGELTVSTYQNADGTKRQSVDVVVNEVEIAFTRATDGEQREDNPTAKMVPVYDDELPF